MECIRFHLNDIQVTEEAVGPNTTVLDYLRENRRLTGTKEGCAEGDCGACTIAVLEPNAPGGPTFRAVNSCLMLLPMLHGKRVYTVEGLKTGTSYHPAQTAMAEALGSQCGYCTPGIVMSIFAATYRDDMDADWKSDDQLCGNLCRCTGYRPIRDALHTVSGTRPQDRFLETLAESEPTYSGLQYHAGNQRFFAPTSEEELFELMEAHPDHRFVCGATDLGLDVTKRHARFDTLISLEAMASLRQVEKGEAGWSIGATVPLSEIETSMESAFPSLTRILRYFGARQIKNRATLGGNICNASPIGDTPPILISLNAQVVLLSKNGERKLPLESFFLAYRKTALAPGEILARVEIPFSQPQSRFGAYKVSKRRELDISAVCAGMRIDVNEDGIVTDACFAYGGMAATTLRANHAENAVKGQPWNEATVEAAMTAIANDFTPLDDHRGSKWYRSNLAANFLMGFFEETRSDTFRSLPDRPSGTVVVGEMP